MIERIGERKGFGDLLGEGVKRASQKIGKGSEALAMHVKRPELPGSGDKSLSGNGFGVRADS